MKGLKITYWISRILLSLGMLFSAGMYIFNYSFVSEVFTLMGYPVNIIYPLAFAKILGVVAINVPKFRVIKNWAYAGFVYVLLLAILAHTSTDRLFIPALVNMAFLVVSYVSARKLKLV